MLPFPGAALERLSFLAKATGEGSVVGSDVAAVTEFCLGTKASDRVPVPLATQGLILSEGDAASVAERIAVLSGDLPIQSRETMAALVGSLVASHAALYARALEVVGALRFYADPESYHAIGFMVDRPAGDFADDFEVTMHSDYDRPMPGKLARVTLYADPSEAGVSDEA